MRFAKYFFIVILSLCFSCHSVKPNPTFDTPKSATAYLPRIQFQNHRFVYISNQTLYILDTVTKQRVLTISNQPKSAHALFFPKGDTILVWGSARDEINPGKNTEILLYEATTGKQQNRFLIPEEELYSCAISVDGKALLAVPYAKSSIQLWSLESGQKLREFEGHQGDILSAVFMPTENQILSVGRDKTIRLWDIQKKDFLFSFVRGNRDPMYAVPAPDGQTILATYEHSDQEPDADIIGWSIPRKAVLYSLPRPGKFFPKQVSFSPTGKQLLLEGYHGVQVMNLKEVQVLCTIPASYGSVVTSGTAAFSLDAKHVLTWNEEAETLSLWDATTCAPIWTLPRYAPLFKKAIVQGDLLAVVRQDNAVEIRSLSKKEPLQIISTETLSIDRVSFLQGTDFLALIDLFGRVWIWDVNKKTWIAKEKMSANVWVAGNPPRFFSLSQSAGEGLYKLWQTKDLHKNWSIWSQFQPASKIRMIPHFQQVGIPTKNEHHWFFTGHHAENQTSSFRFREIETKTGKVSCDLQEKTHAFLPYLSLSAEGGFAAVYESGGWVVDTKQCKIQQNFLPTASIRQVVFQPNEEKYFLATTSTGMAYLFDVSTKKWLFSIKENAQKDPLRSVAWVNDNQFLVVGLHSLRLWDVQGNLLQVIRGSELQEEPASYEKIENEESKSSPSVLKKRLNVETQTPKKHPRKSRTTLGKKSKPKRRIR